ncbi:MAG: flippase-like domain-containing protein, partial [Anaerolineales bacterium]|nr:flippase-like domain-containing protein [Anaerolineales bacterium]
STYRLVGVKERLSHLLPLTAAANFINVVAPSYGLGALAVLITDGRRRGKPAAKVSTAVILFLVYDYLGFMVVLALGLTVMAKHDVLDTVLIAASAFAISIAVMLITLTLLGIQSAQRLGQAVLSLTNLTNRFLHPFIHRELISPSRSQGFANNFSEGLQHIRSSPSGLILPAILALTQKALMITILYLVSVAFHYPLNLDTLIASFSTSYLFTIASVTPSGVGFVEGAMTLYLQALQVPLATSAVISIAYRSITFWLILVYGIVAIRWVGYRPAKLDHADAAVVGSPSIESLQTASISSSQAGHVSSPVEVEDDSSPVSTPPPHEPLSS